MDMAAMSAIARERMREEEIVDMEAMAAIARAIGQTDHEDAPEEGTKTPLREAVELSRAMRDAAERQSIAQMAYNAGKQSREEDGPRAFEMTFVQDTEHGQMELVLRLPPRLVAVLGGQLLAWLAGEKERDEDDPMRIVAQSEPMS